MAIQVVRLLSLVILLLVIVGGWAGISFADGTNPYIAGIIVEAGSASDCVGS